MSSSVRRWLTIATVVVGLVVLSVAAVTLLADRQTVMTLDQAVADFRAGDSAISPSGTPEAMGTDPVPERTDEPTPADPSEPGTEAGTPAPTVDDAVVTEPAEPDPPAASGEAPPQEPQVQETRSSGPAAGQRDQRLTVPEEGVYTYATDGSESVDVLGGSQHDYPERTTITVRHTSCGYSARWEPLRERWETFDICRGDDRAWMRTITLYHEFFGRGMRHDYACGEHATLAEASSRSGQRWAWDCHSEDGSMRTVLEVVGFDAREIGGRTVDAVRVRIHNTMEGDTRGSRTAEVWYDRWSGLELEGNYETDATVDSPMGPSRYTERFSRTLTDLRPRR